MTYNLILKYFHFSFLTHWLTVSRNIRWSCILVCLSVCSCGGQTKPSTLGQLKYKEKKEQNIEFKKMNHQEVRQEYKELLDLFEDKTLKEQIERRIADVYMMEGVQDQLQAKEQKSYYVEAIKSYREILKKYPNSPDNAEVLYQLAKAYDIEGRQKESLKMLKELTTRHPSYKNISEAYFRMGDIYFNLKKYGSAERSYRAVISRGNEKLVINARYMLGWALYKQLKFNQALASFSDVLSTVMQQKDSIDGLSKTDKSFVQDSLHSISLTLARSGGADLIEKTPTLVNKPFTWMIYEDLGGYFLDKERFEDSAFTYRLFVNKYRQSSHSPTLHKRLIKSYIDGGFALQAIEEKEVFINYYGIHSKYSGNKQGLRSDLKKPLKQYIDEVARNYHSDAQKLQKNIAEIDSGKVIGNKKQRSTQKSLMGAAYNNAANFYQQYIDTFPTDERIGEITFLKAEAYFSASRFSSAIVEYEKVAYTLTDAGHKKHGADAGYAAIISYQSIIDPMDQNSREAKKWQQKAVDTMFRFSEKYHADKRAPKVLTNASEYLFSLNRYERALEVASGLVSNNKSLDLPLKKAAYGIMAHSQFMLKDYVSAEKSYLQQRRLVKKSSKEYSEITERLAATIYKNTELILADGNKQGAIKELIKIKRVAPKSSVRITAQYDAATMMLELEQWQQAINEFKEMNSLFPGHKFAIEFPRKIAFAYEKMKNWRLAGDSYLALSKNDKDANVRREALFVSANMYEKDKQYETAITLFKRYAHLYEQPFDTRMEARYHLALNYGYLNDIGRQLYWLRRIVDGDKKGGEQRTDRSRWLGAWANIKYGDYFADEYKRRRLRLPLDKSLAKKNKHLQDSVARYQAAADYGILEFTSMSSHKIANLYVDFASALRQSPVPKSLSVADRKTYRSIIEEQASPFVELALELYMANIQLIWDGRFNEWLEKSFIKMRLLKPERFNKKEYSVSYGDAIY